MEHMIISDKFGSLVFHLLYCCITLKILAFFFCGPLKKIIYLFIFVCTGSLLLCRGFSLVALSGGYSSLWCVDFSLQWLLLLRSTGSRRMGFSSCGTWAQQWQLTGSRAQAQQLWHVGSVVVARGLQSTGSVVVALGLSCPTTCGIFQDQGSNHVPCIGRRILNHCTTREAPMCYILT